MSAEREELARLVDQLPDEQVPVALAALRSRTAAVGDWPPAWFGIEPGDGTPVGAQSEDVLAEGFGRQMLLCDTGPLVAAGLSRDPDHRACVDLFTGMHLAGRPMLVDDVAAVAAAALLGAGHEGRAHSLTGPQMLTRRELLAHLGRADLNVHNMFA